MGGEIVTQSCPPHQKYQKKLVLLWGITQKDESLHAYFGISLQGEAINNKDVTSPKR